MSELNAWDSFYVIVGSAAGALIGLQFVVMTLIADRPALRAAPDAGAAFATPTIVHFAYVLFLSALLRIPWQSMPVTAAVWGAMGFSGAIYALITARRMRRQTLYAPVFEDWLFHCILPLAAYATLVVAAFTALSHAGGSLLAVGAAVLLLLVVGIHNAWDAVAYHVFVKPPKHAQGEQSSGQEAP